MRGCSPEEAQSALWNLTEASGQGQDMGLEPRKIRASLFQVLGTPYHGVQTAERGELVCCSTVLWAQASGSPPVCKLAGGPEAWLQGWLGVWWALGTSSEKETMQCLNDLLLGEAEKPGG